MEIDRKFSFNDLFVLNKIQLTSLKIEESAVKRRGKENDRERKERKGKRLQIERKTNY